MPTTENTDRRAANLTDRTFGVEFEFVGISRDDAAAAMNRVGIACEVQYYNHRTARVWKVVPDSSVANGGELVSPVLRGAEGLREVAAACRAMSAAGARVDVRCGFHVHVGANEFLRDGAALARLVDLWETAEDLGVRGVLAPSRREGGSGFHWAKRLPADLAARARSCGGLESLGSVDRYCALNLDAHRRTGSTVEFRAHAGTLDAEKSVAWIALCLRVVEVAAMSDGGSSRSGRRSSRGSADGRMKNLAVRLGLRTYARDGFAEVAPVLKWAGAYLIARRAYFGGDRVPAVRGNLDRLLAAACESARAAA